MQDDDDDDLQEDDDLELQKYDDKEVVVDEDDDLAVRNVFLSYSISTITYVVKMVNTQSSSCK